MASHKFESAKVHYLIDPGRFENFGESIIDELGLWADGHFVPHAAIHKVELGTEVVPESGIH